MHGIYPANQNKYSEYTDLMGNRFILGLFMVDNLGETTSFIYGTIDFKPSYNDTFTDDSIRDVSSSQTFYPNAWKSGDGKRSPTQALSAVSMGTSDKGGNIQLLVLLVWSRMPYNIWKRQRED